MTGWYNMAIDCTGVWLQKGAKGEKVKTYQEALIKLGYYKNEKGTPYLIDGDYGNETYKAVYKFQKDHNLKADGIIGARETCPAIKKELEKLESKNKVTTSTTKTKNTTVTTTKKKKVIFNPDKYNVFDVSLANVTIQGIHIIATDITPGSTTYQVKPWKQTEMMNNKWLHSQGHRQLLTYDVTTYLTEGELAIIVV